MNSKYIYTYVRTSRPCLSEIARGNENFKRSPDIKYQGFQDRCPPPLTRFRVRDRTRIELVVLVLVVVLVVGKSVRAYMCVCASSCVWNIGDVTRGIVPYGKKRTSGGKSKKYNGRSSLVNVVCRNIQLCLRDFASLNSTPAAIKLDDFLEK